MQIRTKYNRINVTTESGSPIKTLYTGKYDKNGHVIVYEKGKQDTYKLIQSYADSVDLNILLKKFVNGDTSALMQRQGEYMDITQFPTTYADLLNVVNQGTEYFNSLPLEIKRKFGNNVSEFISTMGTDQWIKNMSNESEKIDEQISQSNESNSNE